MVIVLSAVMFRLTKGGTMKTKPILLASSPTLDGIKTCISKFYYGEKTLIEVSPNNYTIHGARGQIEGVRVVFSKGRFRFEGER